MLATHSSEKNRFCLDSKIVIASLNYSGRRFCLNAKIVIANLHNTQGAVRVEQPFQMTVSRGCIGYYRFRSQSILV